MQTSNFGKDLHSKFSNPWNISRKTDPRRMRTGIPEYKDLAPSEELLTRFKTLEDKGKTIAEKRQIRAEFWPEYTEQYYRENLDLTNPSKVIRDLGEDATLLCVCRRDYLPYCHRILVAEWLEESLGIKVPEWR
jgi:uncharacterized protein YeaO (DUF488 family)